MILAVRTDSWDAELYLLKVDGTVIDEKAWNAGRNLSKELLAEIETLAEKQNGDVRDPEFLNGLVVFAGPGSFTGLRIGVSVMNTLAYSLGIPIVGTRDTDWLQDGLGRLKNEEDDVAVIPDYGRKPNITKPKK